MDVSEGQDCIDANFWKQAKSRVEGRGRYYFEYGKSIVAIVVVNTDRKFENAINGQYVSATIYTDNDRAAKITVNI